jgi:choline dehydrogenase-like flavoprotein
MKYSAFSLVYEALRGHTGWTPAWRDPEPKREYDVIIVGGGGHGLATAYYLAKEHGLTNVAVLEKGWIRSARTPALTTIRAT